MYEDNNIYNADGSIHAGNITFAKAWQKCRLCGEDMKRRPVNQAFVEKPGAHFKVNVSAVDGKMYISDNPISFIWACTNCRYCETGSER